MSKQESQPPGVPPPVQMMQLIWPGAMASQAIYVAARLGIPDALRYGPRTIDELARATQTHGPSLHRLLRALTSLGIFAEPEAGRFENTVLSDTLRSDVQVSVKGWAIYLGAPFNWKLWGDLYETVKTGDPAAIRVYEKPFFVYLAENPGDAAIFNAAMTAGSGASGAAIVSAYDFSGFERIVDVGGGHGALLQAILSANPKLKGVLYDLPEVVANAGAGRFAAIGGDFFEKVPEGADAYILKGIIHDWSDEDALRILKNCRRAIRSDGRLLLFTSVLKPSVQSDRGNFMDIYMLLFGGRERTESEFRSLLQEAGFSLTRVIPTATTAFIIESKPV